MHTDEGIQRPSHHRRKLMNVKQITTALIAAPLFVACGVNGGTTPAASTPTVTVTAEPEPEYDEAELARIAAHMVWSDQTAEDRKIICGLFRTDPEVTMRILTDDVDDEAVIDAVETLLEEEC